MQRVFVDVPSARGKSRGLRRILRPTKISVRVAFTLQSGLLHEQQPNNHFNWELHEDETEALLERKAEVSIARRSRCWDSLIALRNLGDTTVTEDSLRSRLSFAATRTSSVVSIALPYE